MILGLRTVAYHVDDLAKVKDWYTKVAAIADPFGNTLGIIENPNFDPKKVG